MRIAALLAAAAVAAVAPVSGFAQEGHEGHTPAAPAAEEAHAGQGDPPAEATLPGEGQAGHDMAGHDTAGHDTADHDTADHDTAGHDMADHDMADHDMAGHDMADHDMAGHDMSDHGTVDVNAHPGHDMATMTGALGAYPMTRDASGTAWQPDVSTHAGVHATRGGWDLMGHALLNGVYDRQAGPRGDEKSFLAGMVMGSARRDLGGRSTLQLRAMLSPDPFMGRSGYPLLLAAGETADGVNTLVDRQHPHDLFMELSASVSRRLSEQDSVFLYGGLPGEPAFGPPAFMHRLSILDSPEAPISHHWLDSTHISYGVVTAGYVRGPFKLEASRFRGREPDENRFDIETGALDSTAARLAWNPSPAWSLQASWADATSPEQLEPDEDVTKWSASAIHTRPVGASGLLSTTLAWGRRSGETEDLDALSVESALRFGSGWTVFARAERVEANELDLGLGHHGPAREVAKASIGAIRDVPLSDHVSVGIGALYSVNFLPGALAPAYDGDPPGAMAFVRFKVE
jgi:hypothetical protein